MTIAYLRRNTQTTTKVYWALLTHGPKRTGKHLCPIPVKYRKKSGRLEKPRTTYLNQIAKHIFKDRMIDDKKAARDQIFKYASDKSEWEKVIDGNISQLGQPTRRKVSRTSTASSVVNVPGKLNR